MHISASVYATGHLHSQVSPATFLLVYCCQHKLKIHDTEKQGWWTGFCFLSRQLLASFRNQLFHTQCSKLLKLWSNSQCPFMHHSIAKQCCLPQSASFTVRVYMIKCYLNTYSVFMSILSYTHLVQSRLLVQWLPYSISGLQSTLGWD